MSTEPGQEAAPKRASPLRRLLWDGVLPEALGLCFVAIIFVGFAAAYLTSASIWRQQARATRQTDGEAFARMLADALGAVTDAGDEACNRVLKKVAEYPGVSSVRWTGSDGKPRFVWPPSGNLPAVAGDGGLPATLVVAAPVRTPNGQAAGMLRVEANLATASVHTGALLWCSGIAAAVTLLVFVAVYARLRRHLRPVAAIERGLQSYAAGIERELHTLMLSESLGAVARGWNQLIDQLVSWQRQSQNAAPSAAAGDVLARFESASYRRVVDRLPLGLLCVDAEQHITYANTAAGALLRRRAEELVGAPLHEAIEDPAVAQAALGVQARTGTGLSVDHTRRDGDHETTVRFRIIALRDEPGTVPLLITVEDISHLKEDQRARDNFLYHVTHELRTPLTSIQAYAETLTKPDFDDEQTRKECYNVIISETRRLSSLVENILSISQFEVGTAHLDVGEVDLVRLLRQMVQDNLGAADEKRIDLTLSLPPKVPKMRGDKQRLAVLLMNLIGNAVKYTPAQGQVRVSLTVAEQCLRVAIADNGIGIGPEDLPHIFEKFYRAADDAVQTITGTGLGLAIAREVARLHGGDIEVQSERGKGSTFTVVLPVASTEPTEVAAP